MKLSEIFTDVVSISNSDPKYKWTNRYMNIAREVSTWSKDPNTQVGAVSVIDGRPLSFGYNGFPRDIEDTDERLHNRELKYELVVHAEKNVIYNACYNGISLKDSDLYLHGLPICNECAKAIIQVGVKNVYMEDVEYTSEVWLKSFYSSLGMFIESNINVYALEN